MCMLGIVCNHKECVFYLSIYILKPITPLLLVQVHQQSG